MQPLFSGGSGARGMTPEGESAVAGLVAGLPEAQGVLCGSILSGLAHPARTLVRRVRLLGHRKPRGRSAIPRRREQQSTRRQRRGEGHRSIGEPVLRDGDDPRTCARRHRAEAVACRRKPPSIPSTLTDEQRADAGIVLLPTSQAEALDLLDGSARIRGILGDPAVDAIVAVRRYEQETYGHLGEDELADKFRMAWSV